MTAGNRVAGKGGQIGVWLRLRCSKSFVSLMSLQSFGPFLVDPVAHSLAPALWTQPV
jgi:hypothetical protein